MRLAIATSDTMKWAVPATTCIPRAVSHLDLEDTNPPKLDAIPQRAADRPPPIVEIAPEILCFFPVTGKLC